MQFLLGEVMRTTICATSWIPVTAVTLIVSTNAVWAQTAAPLAAPSAAAPAAVLFPPAGVAPAAAAPGTGTKAPATAVAPKARECTRLPLSDIQVGKDKTIEVARLRLDEYVAKVGKQRGWKSWDKSLETVACEDYLYVPLLGQEYKCLVTATFCKKM
jgi:hypothetical protein